MKVFLITGIVCVPIYMFARQFSDTFFCGALAGIVCCAIDQFIDARVRA